MSLTYKLNVAVIGATGYSGLDLIFLLSKHPKVNIINLCATKNLGKKISFFDKRIKKNLPRVTSIDKIIWEKLDLVFLSLPNGEAQKIIKKTFYKYQKLKYVDLYKFLCVNFFSKFLPAPEYPDFESIVILLISIIFFFNKGIKGICIEVE